MRSKALLLALALALPVHAISQTSSTKHSTGKQSQQYSSAETKLDKVARHQSGTAQTTQFSADELSAYVNEGGVALPNGVENVKFSSTPRTIVAVTKVDFDKITAGKSSMNPLMILFNGVHDVTVTADAQAAGGTANVNIQSVQIDGVNVPRAALEYFVSKYITPKYGENVGMNNTFKLPANIDTAVVGQNTLTLTQR
jgi:hypothetical protein